MKYLSKFISRLRKVSRRRVLKLTLLSAIFLLAFFLRYRIAVLHSVTVDEPIYMNVVRDFSRFIEAGSVHSFINYQVNLEHPAFGKFLFSIPYLVKSTLFSSRLVSVILGSLTVLLIARRNFFGGIFLAVETVSAFYSSLVYLDALVVFFALASVLLYEKSSESRRLLYLSGIFGGLAFATKYTALPILAVIPALILLERQESSWRNKFKDIFIWASIAGVIFIAVNPQFWKVYKIPDSLLFHMGYAAEHDIYPFWYQLSWIWSSAPTTWNPELYVFSINRYITIFGFLGLPVLINKGKKTEALWFIFTLGFLLVWPTKWPQYTLIFTPALAVSAGVLTEEVGKAIYRSWRNIGAKIRGYLEILYDKLISIKRFLPAVALIGLVLSASLFLTIGEAKADNKLRIRESKSAVLIDSKKFEVKFSLEGAKITSWRLEDSDVNPIVAVSRGSALSYPYEWIPTGVVGWPGEIYSSKFDYKKFERGVKFVTKLEKDAPGLRFIKRVEKSPNNPRSLNISYTLRNESENKISISTPENWREYGFAVDLACAIDEASDDFQVFSAGKENYIKKTWKFHRTWGELRYAGVVDPHSELGFVVFLENSRRSEGIWFERSDKWLCSRILYKPLTLEPGESITYQTRWFFGNVEKIGLSPPDVPPPLRPPEPSEVVGPPKSTYIVGLFAIAIILAILNSGLRQDTTEN